MAGTDPRFPTATVEAAIRFAMRMGLPDATDERPTFVWNPNANFAIEDLSGHPYNFNDAPTSSVQHPPVQIDCVVEYENKTRLEQTSIGEFDPSKATIYIISSDWDQVAGADEVLMGGNTYNIKTIGYPISLFDFQMYPIYVAAVDQGGVGT